MSAVGVTQYPAGTKPVGRQWCLLGWHTRYMLRQYLRHLIIVVAVLLSVSLTSDMAPLIDHLIQNNLHASYWWIAFQSARLIVLRSTDLLAELLPTAFFLAVLWTEVALTSSRERLVIWSLGKSPLECVVPVILLGIAVGMGQFALDSYLRPAAVMAMGSRPSAAHPGLRFSARKYWIASDGRLIHGRLNKGPPPRFKDLTIYGLARNGDLISVIDAKSAEPEGSGNVWTLHDGWVSRAGAGSSSATTPSTSIANLGRARHFTTMTLALQIDSLWLSRYGTAAQYLPQKELASLANAPSQLPAAEYNYPAAEYRVWYDLRYAHLLLPGAMGLFATALCLIMIPYRLNVVRVFAVAVAGYASHVSTSVSLIFGEYSALPAAVAAWIVPLALLLISAVLVTLFVIRQAFDGAGEEPKRSRNAAIVGRPLGKAKKRQSR